MDTKDLPKELPSRVYEFEFECTGNVTNQKYTGKFKFQIPNNRARANTSKLEARLNEGLRLDQATATLHYMMAYLRFALIEDSETKHPKWYVESDFGYDLLDPNVITELYLKCDEFEKDWNEKVFGRTTTSGD